jgi:N-acetylglutamate synthase-like GNAT family acetyltransferase
LKARLARLSDVEDLSYLYSELNPDDPVLPLGEFENKMRAIIENGNLQIFVLENEGKMVATCYLNIVDNLTRNLAPYAVIENVVTNSKFRGRGFGKNIVKFALDEAWKLGCYKVMLLTGSKKEATLMFYESCGFSKGEKIAFLAKPA